MHNTNSNVDYCLFVVRYVLYAGNAKRDWCIADCGTSLYQEQPHYSIYCEEWSQYKFTSYMAK